MGDELLGALPTNPYGHFEDLEVLNVHRQILDDHEAGWQVDQPHHFHVSAAQWRHLESFVAKRRAHHPRWGFKDPRVCLFLGVWRHLLPDAKWIVVYRDPSECIRSIEQRQSRAIFDNSGPVDDHRRFFNEPDHGLRVWNTYNRSIVNFVRAEIDDCIVVPYERLTGGAPIICEINARFDTDLDEIPTETVFDPSIVGRRDRLMWSYDEPTHERVRTTWRSLDELAVATGGAA